tara:strand:+ start:807 stop:1232 length:426 start_codon:yes stop_codon:yes gene_type:complete
MISFINHKTSFLLDFEPELLSWLNDLAHLEGYVIKKLQYNYVSLSQIQEINNRHLGHDYPTDVITFDYSSGKQITGEVFICPDQVESNAKDYRQSVDNEMIRVISHSLFHLCGYKDSTPDQKSIMTLKEDEAIAAFHTFLK